MPPKKDGRKASLKQRHADAADARSRGAILANDRDDDGGQWEFTPAAQALVDAEDAQLDAEVASDEEPLEPSAKAARLATNPGVEVKRRNHAAAERRSSHRRKAPAMPTLADWLHRGRGIEKSGPQRPGTTEANSSAIEAVELSVEAIEAIEAIEPVATAATVVSTPTGPRLGRPKGSATGSSSSYSSHRGVRPGSMSNTKSSKASRSSQSHAPRPVRNRLESIGRGWHTGTVGPEYEFTHTHIAPCVFTILFGGVRTV